MFIDDFGMGSPGIGLNGMDLLGAAIISDLIWARWHYAIFLLARQATSAPVAADKCLSGESTWREYLRSLTQKALKSTT